jgi:Zn-finger nucleic acid-binding protein
MNCPTCKIGLETKLAGPVEVHACPQCEGVWYEGEELRLAKDASDTDLNWLDFEIWKDWESLDLKLKNKACPGCNQKLVGVRYAETPVEIDCCPTCKAIWLEKGEFAAIVASLEAEVVSKPFSKYVKASVHEALDILTGPESLSSEWKDFRTVLRLAQYRLLAENSRASKVLVNFQSSTQF